MSYNYKYLDGLIKIEYELIPWIPYKVLSHKLVICINHPVIYYSEMIENKDYEIRGKLSFNTGVSYIRNYVDNYWYMGFMILGFGIGIAKQRI